LFVLQQHLYAKKLYIALHKRFSK